MGSIELIDDFLKYDGEKYQINSDGLIYTKISPQGHLTENFRIANHTSNSGYEWVAYKHKKIAVHRIIFRKFGGKLIKGLEINHKNGIRNDNRIENLEQVTPSDNLKHKYQVLLNSPVVGNSKINQEIADCIREDHIKGLSYSKLIEKYGVGKSNISYIVNNRIWVKK